MHDAPIWFYVVSVVALFWNIIGLLSFYARIKTTPEAIAALPKERQALFAPMPLWAMSAYGLAVVAGTLGCVALLMRSEFAQWLFVASLIGIIVQNIHSISAGAYSKQGVGALVFGAVIAFIAALLVYLSWFASINQWLG